jgi:hypothetical protein
MNHYFDDLARTLASGLSRRQAMWRIGGILAGTALGALGVGSRARADTHAKCKAFCEQCKGAERHHCEKTCLACSSTSQMCGSCSTGFTCCSAGETCVSGTCVSAGSCTDGIKDGLETDVDCGGPVCAPCASGKHCLVGTDCISGTCNMGVCA